MPPDAEFHSYNAKEDFEGHRVHKYGRKRDKKGQYVPLRRIK